MTDEEIAKARALCEAATPGPWTAEYGTSDRAPTINGPARPGVAGFPVPVRVASNQDAAFIAAARTLVPVLLDALESMRLHAANLTTDLHKAQGHARMWSRHNDEARERADKAERDLAATKAALVEAMELAEDGWRHAHFSDKPKGAARLAALKAKVRP